MKTTLAKLLEQSAKIEQLLIENAGEITPDISELLKIQKIELPQKVESYSFIMTKMHKTAEFYAEKAEFYKNLQKAHEKFIDTLKETMKFHMHLWGITEAIGIDSRFVLIPTQGSLEIVDESAVPERFKDIVQTVKIRHDDLKKAIKSGEQISGAKLNQGYSLRHYAAKPKT